MPALQVKDFPADLYEELRVCAQSQDRSISQQTTHILRSYLRAYRWEDGAVEWIAQPAQRPASTGRQQLQNVDTPEARAERHRRVFEEIDALPKFEVPDDFPSAAEIVREMRDERFVPIEPEPRDAL